VIVSAWSLHQDCGPFAEDEEAIREHAKISGFPASVITELKAMIDPTTGT
jgi:hypothetical protein